LERQELSPPPLKKVMIDFHFSPEEYSTAICFPDDWQKTLATETGALGYDFGPGPYAKPLTTITVGAMGKDLRVSRQYFEDPRVPIVVTELVGDGVLVKQQSFALVPDRLEPLGNLIDGRVRRIGGLNGCIGWALPVGQVDPAFRSVAWGTNRPIKYRVKVEPGSKKRVAIGLCESFKPRAGTRITELRIEGSAPLTVDPMIEGKPNTPYVFLFDAQDTNNDGWLEIEAHCSPKILDPNVFLNVFWIFPEGSETSPDALIRGENSLRAELYFDCGTELERLAPSPRIDGILATYEGEDVGPTLVVRTRRVLTLDSSKGVLEFNGRPFVLSRPKAVRGNFDGGKWLLELPDGTKSVEVISIHGWNRSSLSSEFPNLSEELRRSREYWVNGTKIPKKPIVVPDTELQYVLDANIRNLYQVREVVDGGVQFQPGPTVYRGLWLPVFLTLMPTLMLGDSLSLRQSLERAMQFQLPSGQVRVIHPTVLLAETPTFVLAMCHYAKSTGDEAWFREHWDAVRNGLRWIRQTREATLKDLSASHYGLMPPAFVDGGVSNENADYGSVWFSMVALEKAIEAARRLGETKDAEEWENVFSDFMKSFRIAAQRDMQKDRHGNVFLPTIVGDVSPSFPQRGQYTFLLPARYGKFFHQKDPLFQSILNGNLAMLDATMKEGMITSAGWLEHAVWAWLGCAHGVAHNLVGNYKKAVEILYAVANHASPLGTWVEEQHTQDAGVLTAGDVSNAESSAAFIHLVRSLIAQERGQDLELLSGVPLEWIIPGARIELNGSFTEFGPISLELNISSDGKLAVLFISAIEGRGSGGRPMIHLRNMREVGYAFEDGSPLQDVVEGSWGQEVRLRLRKLS
jgi:hypothetical protein